MTAGYQDHTEKKFLPYATFKINALRCSAIKEGCESAQEIGSRSWQCLCALGQVIDVVDTKQAEPRVRSRVVFVPVLLADVVWQAELGPLIRHRRVLSQDDVAGNTEHPLRYTGGFERLVVETDVPNARSAVLGSAGSGFVEEELLAGGVGAQKSCELVTRNCLVLEERDE